MRARVKGVGETQIFDFGMWQENNIKATEIISQKGENEYFNFKERRLITPTFYAKKIGGNPIKQLISFWLWGKAI